VLGGLAFANAPDFIHDWILRHELFSHQLFRSADDRTLPRVQLPVTRKSIPCIAAMAMCAASVAALRVILPEARMADAFPGDLLSRLCREVRQLGRVVSRKWRGRRRSASRWGSGGGDSCGGHVGGLERGRRAARWLKRRRRKVGMPALWTGARRG
jgi:hypothetical protein